MNPQNVSTLFFSKTCGKIDSLIPSCLLSLLQHDQNFTKLSVLDLSKLALAYAQNSLLSVSDQASPASAQETGSSDASLLKVMEALKLWPQENVWLNRTQDAEAGSYAVLAELAERQNGTKGAQPIGNSAQSALLASLYTLASDDRRRRIEDPSFRATVRKNYAVLRAMKEEVPPNLRRAGVERLRKQSTPSLVRVSTLTQAAAGARIDPNSSSSGQLPDFTGRPRDPFAGTRPGPP